MAIETIERIKSTVIHIVADVRMLTLEDVTLDSLIPGGDMPVINDETCLWMDLNISTAEAGQCRTVGEYVELVKQKLEST